VLDLVEAQAAQLKARITPRGLRRQPRPRRRGARVPVEYGDLANPDALEHLGIEEARTW